jgi:phage recombination protein Bet
MNALTKIENTALVAMSEQELLQVLQTSLYPGAKLESIRMVLGYCKAAGLDPMQKPVHIVPMKVSTGEKDERGWDIKADRDVIMPGVGLYRTQASRSGQYAGVSDPEFGPTKKLAYVTERWVDNDSGRGRSKISAEAHIEYPEWCRVSVTRIVGGEPREFSAREYWLENYATKGSSSDEPNAMWKKRPFAQLAKCAEAQALRKAFPEMTGSQPTAEEMEGKTFDDERTVDMPTTPAPPPGPTEWPADLFAQRLPEWHKAIRDKKATPDAIVAKARTKYPLTAEQEKAIREVPKPEATDVAPKVTFAQVADGIAKAENLDELAVEGTLIKHVEDEQQRKELSAKYDLREAELKEQA